VSVKRLTQFGTGFIVATVLLGSLAVMPATASAERAVECASGTQVGSKVPVVFMHGLGSRPKVWEGLKEVVGNLPTVFEPVLFDYESVNTQWITNPNIGPKLAETIDCLSQASLQGGGDGKVITVGHSQGNLAIEFAANQTVDGRKVSDELASVIAIAAPFQGSILGNASSMLVNSVCLAAFPVGRLVQQNVNHENCLASLAIHGLAIGSEELKALPPFPEGVPVKVIAGNVTPEITLGLIKITGPPENSDLVVGVDSATMSERFTELGKGDGKKVIGCTGVIMVPMISDASCEHSKLLTNKDVQEEVKKSIQDYIASTKTKDYTFNGLTLHLDPKWITEDLGWAFTVTDPAPCHESSDCSTLSVYPLVGNEPLDKKLDYSVCRVAMDARNPDFSQVTEPEYGGERKVGNKVAQYYERRLCAPSIAQETLRYWLFDDVNLMIVVDDLENHEMKGIDELLANATWQ
jgi:hypothetical protein